MAGKFDQIAKLSQRYKVTYLQNYNTLTDFVDPLETHRHNFLISNNWTGVKLGLESFV